MSIKRIWITGASGFIGSHLVRALGDADAEIICFTTVRHPEAGNEASAPVRHHLDFQKRDDVRRAVDRFGVPDAFIHLGWGAMEDPGSDEHLNANLRATQNLIDTLYACGLPRFVFLGSVNEYGGRTGGLEESMPTEGRLTNYARGKLAASRYGLDRAAAFGRIFVAIRLFYTFGEGQRPGSLINKLHRCFLEGSRPDLGPCEHYRDYIYVGEAADGIRRLCEAPQSAIVNLGSGHAIQVKDFVALFWRQLGGDATNLDFGALPMRAGEPEQPRSFANLDRLRQLTSWAPSLSIEAGIQQTIAGLRKAQPAAP